MTNEEIDALWDRCREHKNNTVELVREIVRLAIAAEREACAETASCFVNGGQEIAAAIRARGEA